ncbi:hypothetical protein NQ317_005125 [Molorchus minor]|uniref:C2H2-type domain-containing protein n=1 Tax=Molorchus minor TaxID=1323400 RepID=A0ABQ9IZ22_9CUCU|nr:hypothetical protein NQ317_005125 [Molorchus minor]
MSRIIEKGKNFRVPKSILQQHMQIHTGKLCKCPKVGCIYSARKMSEIKEHYKTHSDTKSHFCDLCDYKGKTKQQLNRHMTIHQDTKKYQCPQCPFTTRTSTHLKRHARLHTGAKPYRCPHCDYKSNTLIDRTIMQNLQENLRKHVLSTNKHPGKCIYACKFCAEDRFQSNFAKEFKAHLVTEHAKMFGTSTEAATYVAGIYDLQDDNTYLNDVVDSPLTRERYVFSDCKINTQLFYDATKEVGLDRGGDGTGDSDLVDKTCQIDDTNDHILNLTTEEDPIVSQVATNMPSTSVQTPNDRRLDQMLPMFIIPKDETVIVDNSPDAWNLVGRYDVEEESGTLIPFQSDGESIFQEHFQ